MKRSDSSGTGEQWLRWAIRRLLHFMLACMTVTTPTHQAVAQSGAIDQLAQTRSIVVTAAYQSAATVSAIKQWADEQLLERRKQIELLQASVKTERLRRDDAQNERTAALTRLAGAEAELTTAQERFLAELAKRDRSFAKQLAVFRESVQDIAATPEGVAALQQYNDGDRRGGIRLFKQIQQAHERAIQVRTNIEVAKGRRSIATVELDARAHGVGDTEAAISSYEAVTALDPSVHQDWIELSRLYEDVGQLTRARAAALRAVELADGDVDVGRAAAQLGDIQSKEEDLVGAVSSYAKCVAIFRRLVSADPMLASSRRNLGVSLVKEGGALIQLGDPKTAREKLLEGIDILSGLVSEYPTLKSFQLDLHIARTFAGLATIDATADSLDSITQSGRKLAEVTVAKARALAAAQAGHVESQRQLAVALHLLSGMLTVEGDMVLARLRGQEALEILEQLVSTDKTSASLLRELARQSRSFGQLLIKANDITGGRNRLLQSLATLRQLAEADSSSAVLKVEVSDGLNELGNMEKSRAENRQARAYYEDSLFILQGLAARGAPSVNVEQKRIFRLQSIAATFESGGDLSSALTSLQEGLFLARQLTATQFGLTLQTTLLELVANIMLRQGDS